MGCTLNCEPSWLSVFSPRIASIATRALNFGLYCFLVVVIDLSSSTTPPNLTLLPGLKSGDHYTPRFPAFNALLTCCRDTRARQLFQPLHGSAKIAAASRLSSKFSRA